MFSEIESQALKNSLNLRVGEEPADVVVRSMQILKHNEKAYAETYSILARLRDHVRSLPEHSPDKEEELQEAMRQCVFLFKSNERKATMAINEIVPGSFPPSNDPSTESPDFDCADAAAAAHAICVVSIPFWELGWPALACIAAQVGVAIACA